MTDLISRADVFEIIDKAFSQPMRNGVALYADICLMLNALPTHANSRSTHERDLISRADAIEAVASITMSIHLSDVICDKLLALPSADTEPKGVLQGYCKGANTIKTIRHEELTQIANTRKAVESADAVQGEWLDGWEVIRELSETRCMYNCFDENDRPMYEAMTSAIDIVRQMMGGARMKGGEDE